MTYRFWFAKVRQGWSGAAAPWRAASIVVAFFAIAVAVATGAGLRSGFGVIVDVAAASIVTLVLLPIFAFAIGTVFVLIRRLQPLPIVAIGAAATVSAFMLGSAAGAAFAVAAVALSATLVVSGLELMRPNRGGTSRFRRIVVASLFFGAAMTSVGLLGLLFWSGPDQQPNAEIDASLPPVIAAENPGGNGPFAIETLCYGSGSDQRRTEYGDEVTVRTPTVDASRFFKGFGGWRARYRKAYWGFGVDKLPLNGRVWYPRGDGPFPLVLMVHGNHNMAEFSDGGYEYLGRALASRGFIFVSVDENFLNRGLFWDLPKQQPVRAWLLLEHLRLWCRWRDESGHPLGSKADLDRVALMGHSRGGEAAATAALFSRLSHYPDDAGISLGAPVTIRSVVAIATVDGQYRPAGQDRVLENLNYLAIHGAHDSDVASFMGGEQFERVRYRNSDGGFKASLMIDRANHSQFNTSWGHADSKGLARWFFNGKPLISGEQQRQFATVSIGAFLEATLHDRQEYLAMFQDPRCGRAWLPPVRCVGRFEAAGDQVVVDFSEDADLTTTTLFGGRIVGRNLSTWREGRVPLKRGARATSGVFLGWKTTDSMATYSIYLPPQEIRQPASVLRLAVAASDGQTSLDFTVELEACGVVSAIPLSRFSTLGPPIEARLMKLPELDRLVHRRTAEPILQSIDLPLVAFAAQSPGFDLARLSAVRLVFNRTPSRTLILKSIHLGD